MPLLNLTSNGRLSLSVMMANSFMSRLTGLLGFASLENDKALYIQPAKDIHTMGMAFPIDVFWLDAKGRLLQVRKSLLPNKCARGPKDAVGVLECQAGTFERTGFAIGDRLMVLQDESHTHQLSALLKIFRLPLAILMSLLWISQFMIISQSSQLSAYIPLSVFALLLMIELFRLYSDLVYVYPGFIVLRFLILALTLVLLPTQSAPIGFVASMASVLQGVILVLLALAVIQDWRDTVAWRGYKNSLVTLFFVAITLQTMLFLNVILTLIVVLLFILEHYHFPAFAILDWNRPNSSWEIFSYSKSSGRHL